MAHEHQTTIRPRATGSAAAGAAARKAPHHAAAVITPTLSLAQLDEINEALAHGPGRAPITSTDLSVAGAALIHGGSGTLPEGVVLVKVCADGPTEFPYIHAHFSANGAPGGRDDSLVAELHTAALRTLSGRLGLHHRWGI